MRRYFFLFFFVLLSFSLLGQSDKWNFSLNMGKSLPLGDFAGKHSDALKSGFSEKGFALSLEANYSISDNFSFTGMALLNTTTVSRISLFNTLQNRFKVFFPLEVNDQEFLSLNVNSWVTNSILFGPTYTVILNNWHWDLYALAGLNIAYLAKPLFSYQNPSNNWIYLHHSLNSTSVSLGLLAGTALRLPVSEKFDFSIGLNYFHAKSSGRFEEIKITKSATGSVTEVLNTGSMNVPIINLTGTLGLVYYLR